MFTQTGGVRFGYSGGEGWIAVLYASGGIAQSIAEAWATVKLYQDKG